MEIDYTEITVKLMEEFTAKYLQENAELIQATIEATKKALAISRVGSAFYCQRDIEGDSICNTQCEHCNEYYKPLEQ